MTVMKVLYVVIAILMAAFILLQRGAGAQQGGGFGAGASATVFGASGSANFLSKSTKWLAALFFGLSIAMAAMISNSNVRVQTAADAGVMSNFSETPALGTPAAAPVASEVPGSGDATTPAADSSAPTNDAAPDATSAAQAPAVESAPATEAVAPAVDAATESVKAAADADAKAESEADKPKQ